MWLVVVAVPYLYLYPGENLDRPTCLLLAALAPAAMLVAAAWSPTHLLLGVGLASHVPILIACPELIGARITGSMQGLAVAVMLLGFVAATFDLATGPQWRASPGRRLRHLARWPKSWTGRLMLRRRQRPRSHQLMVWRRSELASTSPLPTHSMPRLQRWPRPSGRSADWCMPRAR